MQVRFLEPGRHQLELDGRALGVRTAAELERGAEIGVERNSTRRLRVIPISTEPPASPERRYDSSVTFLSDLAEAAAQRGVGLPEPAFQKDRSFRGSAITLSDGVHRKGLGLAANTVVVYKLDGNYRRLAGIFGVDRDAAAPVGPKPSVCFTVFVDGRARFASGPMPEDTQPKTVDIDAGKAQVLVLRMSGDWEDNGNLANDMGSFAEARLIGKALQLQRGAGTAGTSRWFL